jgi:LysM repeat protein
VTPVVIVATPTGPTQTPDIRIVTATPSPEPDEDIQATNFALTAEAVHAATTTGDTEVSPRDTDEPDDTVEDTPTLSPGDLTATEAAANQRQTHVVESGEYYGLIAENYDVTVEDLLCQNGLEEDDFIYPGDVLVIPGPDGCDYEPPEEDEEPTITPTPRALERTATPTQLPTPSIPPTAENAQAHITEVLSAGDVTEEELLIVNEGGVIDMEGWTLSDQDGNVYTFPDFRLFPGGSVSVRTRTGEDTPIVRYWNQTRAVWGDEGDIATLTDADGNVQSIFVIGEPEGVPGGELDEEPEADEVDEADETDEADAPSTNRPTRTSTPEPVG